MGASLRVVKSKRPTAEPIRNPTLFPIDKLEEEGKLTDPVISDRPFSLPGILLGTSAFTAAGWEGSTAFARGQPKQLDASVSS